MTTPGIAIPGTNVPASSLVSSGGAQGIQGVQGPTGVSADANNLATLGSDGLISVPSSSIWSVRLRSFNAIGNPNFEVDQRNYFASLPNIANGIFPQDRWQVQTVGTMRANYLATQGLSRVIPGTSFRITQAQAGMSVATTEPTLAAGDYWILTQRIEGPLWRELVDDVSSISILAYSSIPNFSFSMVLRSADATVSLVKLCTIPLASTWTLISLPNIPKPTSGSFPLTPGSQAYFFSICLAAGSTYMAPAADSWQNGNFLIVPGVSNLFATAGAAFYLAFVQHEPGPVCTTLIDKPFSQNYDECLRYYQKTWDYVNKPGTVSNNGICAAYFGAASTNLYVPVRFHKPMAKAPTILIYSNTSGAVNVYNYNNTSDTGVAAILGPGTSGYGGFVSGGAPAAGASAIWNHTADTGW